MYKNQFVFLHLNEYSKIELRKFHLQYHENNIIKKEEHNSESETQNYC